MGFPKINRALFYVSFSVFICLHTCGNCSEVDSGFKIYRCERDIFTSLEIKTGQGFSTSRSCKEYHAECISEDNCTYCRCEMGFNTFLTSNHDKLSGSCTRDEDIVPDSGNRYFI